MRKTYNFFLAVYVMFSAIFCALAGESDVSNSLSDSRAKNSDNRVTINSKNNSTFMRSVYLHGDVDLLSGNAPVIVGDISDKIYRDTNIQVMIYIVRKTTHYGNGDLDSSINQKFNDRRAYETEILENLRGKYVAIFLFYEDHAITLRSNLDFLGKKVLDDLLERYAYPYLPADSVGTSRYDDGVNDGVSNLYLALINSIADHYNIDLGVPKPMEQTDGVTKVILYVMLLILIALFIVVRFGLGLFNKKV